MTELIYMDAAASTPIAPEALTATFEALGHVGNPGAAHISGRVSTARVNAARDLVAELMHVGPAGVTFVGSATEANNLAIRGLVRSRERGEVVTTTVDHPSVLATVADTARGEAAHFIPVRPTGEIDLEALAEALSPRTALVSIHAANNETGVVQPLHEIVEKAHSVGALVHMDASQLMAWGESPLLDLCDLVTVSSHKMHGPQGAAALIVRPPARERLRPQITGGGQERGLRSGTVNVAAIAGFGAAAKLALESGHAAADTVSALRSMLMKGLEDSIGDVVEHGSEAASRLPGILNVAIGINWADSVESEALLARLPRLAASTGSACHAGAPGPSAVLRAMGVSDWEASRSLRLSLSRYTTTVEAEAAVSELARGIGELRQLFGQSDLYERYAL